MSDHSLKSGQDLPTGTVTFLFTDIEGSTKLWEQHPEEMRAALVRHDNLIEELVQDNSGVLVRPRGEGDSRFAVFPRPSDSIAAACDIGQAFLVEPWGIPNPLRVRMALHTGEADLRAGDYYGSAVNRCARLRALAYGGQIVLSSVTTGLVRDVLPEGIGLRDLGEHRLKDLQHPERVFQLTHPDLPADFPTLKSLDSLPNNLPLQLTSFVGREEEIKEVKRLFTATRLLTLTGSGGCGKTRLSLQVLADLVDEFPDGVWVVELAALSDPALVAQEVASTLGVREGPGNPLLDMLLDYLQSKQLLLLLDNCEHLMEACAALVDNLLRSCPNLIVLAASREALGIGGESTYRVPSLSLPDPKSLPPVEKLRMYEAVSLFIDRAVAAVSTFRVTNHNAPAVAQVCQRLDGIPLAIELAAARVKVLTVEQIAERLDNSFRLLTGGSRTALPRQQTLRALIDWSYNLLTETEGVLLGRLSVFMGGWTLPAVEAVCDGEGIEEYEVLELLTSLVEKSLVVAEEAFSAEEVRGEARYRLLETVRQYAGEKLMESGEAARLRERHLEWYLGLAEKAEPELQGGDQVEWLEQLELEHDNLKAALEWSEGTEEKAEVGLRLAGALYRFWLVRGYLSEGGEWLKRKLAEGNGASASTPARAQWRAKALNGAGALSQRQGDLTRATTLLEESLSTFREIGDKAGMANSIRNLGLVAMYQDDRDRATGLFEESLSLFREVRDKGGIAISLRLLGQTKIEGNYDRAMQMFEESLTLCRELGDKAGMANSLRFLGYGAIPKGDYKRARELLEESLALCHEIGDKDGIAFTLLILGTVAQYQEDHKQVSALFEESLVKFKELGDKMGISMCLRLMSLRVGEQEQHERAARLNGAAEALGDFSLPPFEKTEHEKSVASVRASLGEEAFESAWSEGRAMSMEEAIDYALKVDDA